MSWAPSAAGRERLIAADRAVCAAGKGVLVLGELDWPAQIERDFLAAPAAPGHQVPRPDVADDRARIDGAAAGLDPDDPGEAFLQRTAQSLRDAVDLLDSLGSPEFVDRSLDLYGRPSDPLHTGAPTILEAAQHVISATSRLRSSPPEATLDAEAARERLQAWLDPWFADPPLSVELDPELTSIASAGSKRVRLRADARFSELQLRQLLHHEALVHAATRRNGAGQPVLRSLGLATPRTAAIQEGLATLAELITDTMDLSRLRRIALRVVAVQAALDGADFMEVYEVFRAGGQPPQESFASAQRVLRGGDGARHNGVCCGIFAKDLAYVRGLWQVHGFMLAAANEGRKELPLRLFSGRLTPGDTVALDPLFAAGWIDPPAVAPRWVREQDCLAAFLVFGALNTRVDLALMEPGLADWA
ncbi:MAG: DUF1704 domain-containing protein [Deltaproteobacteria bacterium]|nr:DUF1704 domain-containing protein [Deltaproteobacteria bacterium]